MIVDIESDPRHAGCVKRYHTWPVIRQQSVGEHTWQAIRIMMTVDLGMCTTRLMHYAMLHDAGEMAGDVPWPGKRDNPKVREGMAEAEAKIRGGMTELWGLPSLPEITQVERDFFKACENLEMWEYALQEQNMGNKYAAVVATRMLHAAAVIVSTFTVELQRRFQVYIEMRHAQESETELVSVRDPRHPLHHRAREASAAAQEFVEREERQA